MPVGVVLGLMMDCRVVVEAAVPVYDVETADEAIRIAISKTGEMLNPDLNYVEIETGNRTSPGGARSFCRRLSPPTTALVALQLRMDVFNVDREEHASRVARKEIGQRLRNIPLEVLRVEEIEGDSAKQSSTDSAEDGDSAHRDAIDSDGDSDE